MQKELYLHSICLYIASQICKNIIKISENSTNFIHFSPTQLQENTFVTISATIEQKSKNTYMIILDVKKEAVKTLYTATIFADHERFAVLSLEKKGKE